MTRAWPATRSRAASMSASVVGRVANPEHLLEDLTNRRQRVELARFDVVEQPAKLGVVAHGVLEMTCVRAPTRPANTSCARLAYGAALELAFGLEPRAVLADLLPERVDALAADRLGEDDRRLPARRSGRATSTWRTSFSIVFAIG